MKRLLFRGMLARILAFGLVLASGSLPLVQAASRGTGRAAARTASEPHTSNPLFAYTHLLPSPFTLPAGTLVLGTGVALGVTDFFQIGTDVIRDAYKIFNANAKLSLIDFPEFALALTGGYENYNLHDISSLNPDLRYSVWQPGITTAYALLDDVAWFVGGNLNFSKQDIRNGGIQTSGYLRGAQVESDISWAYNPPTRSHAVSNALSAGVSYDVTYKLVGFGISHHWPGFHLGVHYYPGATDYKLLPIVVGGMGVSI